MTTGDPSASLDRALRDLHRGAYDDALVTCNAIGIAFPDEPRAFIYGAEALLAAGRADEAFAHLAAVEERFAVDGVWIQVLLGKIELRRGDADAAAGRFRAVLERFPHHADAVEPIAAELVRAGRWEHAREVLAWARAAHPAHPAVERAAAHFAREERALQRRIVLLSGNCQAHFLSELLNLMPTVSEKFRFVTAVTHSEPGQPVPPVPPEADNAELYWEQYDERADVPVRTEVRERVNCRAVTFPPVIYLSLWPFAWPEPRNVPEAGFPFGRYPWGDRIAQEVGKLGLPAEKLFGAYMELSRRKMPDVHELFARDRALAERRDAACDVKITDFFVSNVRSRQLLWTWGHITSEVAVELIRGLWRQSEDLLGALTPAVERELAEAAAHLPGQDREQLPIHPHVVDAFGLTYCPPDRKYGWHGQWWTFEEYITRYITFDRSW